MLFIGIDLGTSQLKALLADITGRIIKSVSVGYPVYYPHPGWSEQDPEDWWAGVKNAILSLVSDADRKRIAGIAVAGQMHGLVALDENDKVIRNAILWNDGRTERETEYLNVVIGKERLSEFTGNIAFAGFTAPKVLWMKENEPENFGRIKKICLPKDYIVYRLTGNFVTDVSDASGTLYFDVKNRRWQDEMLKICSIRREWLPEVHESYDFVGTVKKDIAFSLGLNDNVKVAAGAGDNAAGAVGTGTVGEGKCTVSVGSSGTIFISSEKYMTDPNNSVHSFAHSDGKYHMLGCILSAAACNKWWMDDILQTKDYDKEQELIHKTGTNPVFFLPYLMGERSPYNDPNARGTFIGMSLDTKREDMTLSVLEGVAFALRDSYERAVNGLDFVSEIKICGGGAKSPLWRRIFANVFNKEILIPEIEEGASYGSCILAMVASGAYPSVTEAAEIITKVKDSVMPDSKLAGIYNERYDKYTRIYPYVKDVFRIIK